MTALVVLKDVARLPGRLAAAAETAIDRLGALEGSVRDIASLLPGIARDVSSLGAELTGLRAGAEPQLQRVAVIEETAARLEARVVEVQATLSRLEGAVRGAVDRLPDPDAPGPLARAKDALTR